MAAIKGRGNEFIRQQLEIIRKANRGRLTKDAVVRAASRPSHPLHRYFNWDNAGAAHKYRLEQARDLIVSVTMIVTVAEKRVRVVSYVSDPTPKKPAAYVPLTPESFAQRDAERIMVAELDRAKHAINRGREVAFVLEKKFPGIDDKLEKALQAIVDAGPI